MRQIFPSIACAVLVTLVGGCETATDQCREFDPPPGHKPSACPAKPGSESSRAAQPARYCYSTLGQVECYSEPQPGRTGYQGSTAAYAPAPAPLPASK